MLHILSKVSFDQYFSCQRVMYESCKWTKYHKFTFYVVTFEKMKIRTLSVPQNDRSEPCFCKRYKYQCSYFDWLKNYDLELIFMIFSPVANWMHHPLYCLPDLNCFVHMKKQDIRTVYSGSKKHEICSFHIKNQLNFYHNDYSRLGNKCSAPFTNFEILFFSKNDSDSQIW